MDKRLRKDRVDNGHARALLRRYRDEGDDRARETLIEGFAPMVRQIAHRFTGRGESPEDLFQIGMVGLIKAVDRFDLERGVALPSYAVPCVIGEIKRHFRDHRWAVRVPRPVKDLANRIPRERERLTGILGRAPTVSELAKALEVEEEALLEATEAWHAYTAMSISASAPTEEGDLSEQLGELDVGYDRAEDRLTLRSGIDALDEREQQILLLYYNRGLTQSEIAARLGYSQMHISRLLRAALEKIRGQIAIDAPAAA